jgi:hypothetical protein
MPLRRYDQTAKNEASRQVRKHGDWIEKLARAGYATKGVIYALFGAITVMAAVEGGRDAAGSKDAIYTIAEQPFGQVLLAIVGVGLVGYALWRFIQAGLDVEHEGGGKKGAAKRVGYAASGVAHVALAVLVGQLLFGGGAGGGGQQTWISQALAQSWGPILIGALGAAIIAGGLFQLYKAYTAKFVRELKTQEMSARESKAARIVGRVGLAARGIVFPIIGVFLLQAAITANPAEARGASVEGALEKIAEAGAIWLALVAAGLVAYGVFQLFMARYRRIDVR